MDHEFYHHHSHQNPNPSSGSSSHAATTGNLDHTPMEFELSDFLVLEEGSEEEFSSQNEVSSAGATSADCNKKCENNGVMKGKKADHGRVRVAFKTKSKLEIMDDGFKWRKYGKKTVKSSPNPRNYFKCASGGCNVKKRVERDKEDSSYVITTYEGVHNHESPCGSWRLDNAPIPQGCTLQPSTSRP